MGNDDYSLPHCCLACGASRVGLSGLRPLPKHPTPGSSSAEGAGGVRSRQLPVLLVRNACLRARGQSKKGLRGYVLHQCCTAAQSWLRAPCVCRVRSHRQPTPSGLQSLKPCPCLQLICLRALISRHHPFLQRQQADAEPACSLNPASAIQARSCPCSWRGGWSQMIFKVPSNPYHSMIL